VLGIYIRASAVYVTFLSALETAVSAARALGIRGRWRRHYQLTVQASSTRYIDCRHAKCRSNCVEDQQRPGSASCRRRAVDAQ